MTTASWHDTVIAQSKAIREVEGNAYFPPDSIKREYLRESGHTSVCPWKGTAHDYDVIVGDQVNANAAWYYPQPKQAAAEIRDHVAFWKGVTVG